MPGTKAGGAKARQTMVDKYGEDFWSKIGKEGGKNGKTGGFYYFKYVKGDDEHARTAGAKGGANSRRGHGTTKPA